MLLTKRYRNIIGLVVIQALLFIFYSVRLHLNNDSRATDNARLSWLASELLGNTTTLVNATEVKNRTYRVFIDDARRPVSSDVTGSWHLVTDNTTTDIQYSTGSMMSSVNETMGSTIRNPSHLENNSTFMVNSSNLYDVGEVLSFPAPNDMSAECVESFLKIYSKYCHAAIAPVAVENASVLCPCIPPTLIGAYKVSLDKTAFEKTEEDHPELLPGGHWAPTSCVPRQRIAIIVPFRDRESHLKVFLRILHPFLQRQLLDYTIFVVEQERPKIFNKASLMNAGFLEVRSRHHHIDCFIFHDVDMLPEDDRNFYGCYDKAPRHVGAYVDKHKYVLLYNDIFGGATAFTEKQFLTLNGYSNEFYGWGGEDDDMFNRVKWTHYKYVRFPKCVARYKMIRHKRDKSNPYSESQANRAWTMRPQVYKKNGLNSLSYRLVSFVKKPLFTRILIALNDPPPVLQQSSSNSTS